MPLQKEKITLSRSAQEVSDLACVATIVHPSSLRNINRIPFPKRGKLANTSEDQIPFKYDFRLLVRTDSLVSHYASHETIAHVSPRISHMSVCYFIQDLHYRPLDTSSHSCFNEIDTSSYTLTQNERQRSIIGDGFERHPFSGQEHSIGELLHTL